jgi:spermine/spermidine synthase
MAISVAFFGLGIGALLVHILKSKIKKDRLPSKILQSVIAFAISLPIFLFVIGHVIPSSTSYIYLFYLASSVPFFFAGISMALVYLAMPRKISKLYFVDLVGAAAATLALDSLMRTLGAESVLISIGLLVIGPSLVAALMFIPSQKKKDNPEPLVIETKIRSYALIAFAVSAMLLATNAGSTILAIQPGEIKGLHYQLANPSIFKHLSTNWNSFSRIDVTRQMYYHNNGNPDESGRSKTLAQVAIDADADTPVFRWNGSIADIQWLKTFMDYLPYEISKANNSTLVIGSGGGEDLLVALAGGSKNVTAVELNPLIVSAAKQFGGSAAGNLYDRKDVHLFVDDGRRFISSTNSKYDKIVIKLVDSWAAQLAGGYALSENYLYTVEAFKQYLRHLNGDNGMLVMVRWNIELPRLMPLVVESLLQEEAGGKRNIQDISRQILVVEDRPGLTFGSNDQRTEYPVLVIVKNSPFTSSELDLVKQRISENDANVIAMPGGYIQPPYDKLLLSSGANNIHHLQQQSSSQVSYDPMKTTIFGLKPPTDDSPFYFAKEQIPKQLMLLIETVLGVSAVLSLLLVYYSRSNKIRLTASSRFHIVFVISIGLGFIFLEITFIQKFLLLLGTPIMALTVILFSILSSSGIGAYLSGRLFNRSPYYAVVLSIPLLGGILIGYYGFLQGIISFSIVLPLHERIALTFALLSPVGILMGFQFPSITRMASSYSSLHSSEGHTSNQDITLLWGINVIASVIGTVLTTTSSMVVGFNGNLLIGFGLYMGALASAIAAVKITQKHPRGQKVADKSTK